VAAGRFADALEDALDEVCRDLAERITAGASPGPVDEAASLAFSRPAYQMLFSTGK
jgi:hypothetical protein